MTMNFVDRLLVLIDHWCWSVDVFLHSSWKPINVSQSRFSCFCYIKRWFLIAESNWIRRRRKRYFNWGIFAFFFSFRFFFRYCRNWIGDEVDDPLPSPSPSSFDYVQSKLKKRDACICWNKFREGKKTDRLQ